MIIKTKKNYITIVESRELKMGGKLINKIINKQRGLWRSWLGKKVSMLFCAHAQTRDAILERGQQQQRDAAQPEIEPTRRRRRRKREEEIERKTGQGRERGRQTAGGGERGRGGSRDDAGGGRKKKNLDR